MAVATNSKILALIISVLVFASLVNQSKQYSHNSISASQRNLLGIQRNRSQIPSCSELVSRSQCSQNPKCRWCQSDSLDDMCFSKVEAWRLPSQVFVCDN